MVALVHNHPRQLSLMEILNEFLKFRREIVTRRTVYLLRQDRRKAHIDEGLMVAKANIQKIIDLITSSQNQDEARARLMEEGWDGQMIGTLIERTEEGINISLPQGIPEDRGLIDGKYYLSEMQARAILALQLSRLTHLAQDEILNDYKALLVNIRGYLQILNDPERMKAVIREDLLACRNEFANKRRTDFTRALGKFDKADLIAKQDVIVTLSYEGYIKYQDIASYESQAHGGKGRKAANLKDEDFVTNVVVANTHDRLMCFTNLSRVFSTTVYDLPTSENRTWRGRPVQNVFEVEENERITAMLPLSKFEDDTYFVLATKKGYVKKTQASAYANFLNRDSNRGLKAIILDEGDELIGADITSGDDDIFLFTSDGRCIRFCEYYKTKDNQPDVDDNENTTDNDEETEDSSKDRHSGNGLRPSGRNSRGVRGIRLLADATVVSMLTVSPDNENASAFIASSNGFGKRMLLDTVSRHNRGGQGVMVMGNLERNGKVIGAVMADDDSEFMLITNQGQLIRSPMNAVRECGRSAAGVIIMRTDADSEVVGLQAISANVVENSHKTQEARQKEKQALKEMEEQEKLREEEARLASEAHNAQQETNEDSAQEQPINEENENV